jgi:hypothetical protein
MGAALGRRRVSGEDEGLLWGGEESRNRTIGCSREEKSLRRELGLPWGGEESVVGTRDALGRRRVSGQVRGCSGEEKISGEDEGLPWVRQGVWVVGAWNFYHHWRWLMLNTSIM